MATEFQVIIEDKPGSLAGLGGVLGDATVNIEAVHGISLEGKSIVQFVPNDPATTARALDRARIAYTRREVLIVRVLDQPGMLADVALVMSTARRAPPPSVPAPCSPRSLSPALTYLDARGPRGAPARRQRCSSANPATRGDA